MLTIAGRAGGLKSYIDEVDLSRVEYRIQEGDEEARLALEGMAYQVSKEIAAMAAVLEGDIDAVVLTGGGAFCKRLVALIEQRIRFLAPVHVIPGELELEALAEGAVRILLGEEKPQKYEGENG
jgi:butyrate kinase